LNTSFFIAKRLAFNSDKKKSFARPIIRFAVISMALGMIVMILAIAIATGFQNEIRKKVVGFGSHITITSLTSNRSMESTRLLKNQAFYPNLDSINGIRHIQVFATKPGIIETDKDIQGVVVKGISSDFDWDFFKDKLIAGERLNLSSETVEPKIIISNSIANALNIVINQKITLYYPDSKKGLVPRNYIVSGIYHTGLEDFDKEWVLTDIRHIQKLNHWGIRGTLEIVDSCRNGMIGFKARGYGGKGGHDYYWSDTTRKGRGTHYFSIFSDTTIRVVYGDVANTIRDTVSYILKTPVNGIGPFCAGELKISKTGFGGTDELYVGGFEIILDNYEQLLKMDDLIYEDLDFGLKTTTIINQVPDIFNWLNMLDTNVYVIIALMILVSVINMASALLILILERTNAIGILKAMGSTSWQIRKIFLYQAGYIIIKGLFWGNLIGILLVVIQIKTHFFKLDQANYFLTYVPMNFQLNHLVGLNMGVLLISLALMILPSWYISKIRPVKAIRFN
jgi:lipoprotein-releasing system permease protein